MAETPGASVPSGSVATTRDEASGRRRPRSPTWRSTCDRC